MDYFDSFLFLSSMLADDHTEREPWYQEDRHPDHIPTLESPPLWVIFSMAVFRSREFM